MRYPIKLTPDHKAGGFVVTFPDVPEAITQGEDEHEAFAMGLEALESSFDMYIDAKEAIPLPSKPKRGQATLDLPASVTATVLLYNEMLRQKVRPAELARRAGIPRQDMTRLLSIRHNTKIDSTAKVLAHLGKRLELQLT